MAQSCPWQGPSSGRGRGATRRGAPLLRKFHEISAKRKHPAQPIRSDRVVWDRDTSATRAKPRMHGWRKRHKSMTRSFRF